MTVEARATGWLNDLLHARWREAMLQALVQHALLCPIYCLMPDHAHFVWLGGSPGSDQRRAVTEFRRTTNRLLAPLSWQREAYDHVLRETERKRDAFATACWYILENPVRKNLVQDWKRYSYSGALVPGYPNLDPRRADFWEVFWKAYNRRVAAAPQPAS
jgi:REP element-mobilizing transposase RayT